MSYILEALKKIEHEKIKRARPDGRINISGDLFQERNNPVASVVKWKVVVLIAAVSLATCAGTWFVLLGNGKKVTTAANPATSQSPVPVTAPLPIMPPVVAAPVQVPATSAPATPLAVPVKAATRDVPSGNEFSPHEARRLKKQSTRHQASVSAQPVQTVQVPADVKLSGIAWQDDRSVRRAVVNGFLLKEGAVVAGARITDIQPDRVRFLSAAGSFEIKLDSVLPTGGK